MKILILSSKINAEHQFTRLMQERGVGLLFPSDDEEAWQTLQAHGKTVDIALIQDNLGLKFLEKVKASSEYADLPMVLLADTWSEAECASHQEGSLGVNAYLRAPISEAQLIETIDAVLGSGSSESALEPVEPSISQGSLPPFTVLEDAGTIMLGADQRSGSSPSIMLESPLLPEDPPQAAPPPPSEQDPPTASPEINLAQGDSLSLILDGEPGEVSAPEPQPLPGFEPSPAEMDSEIQQEMPYLFKGARIDPALLFAEPLGDAVVPGGAAESPDMETVKKYLLLREQDVGVLSTQLKASQDQISIVEQLLREEKARNAELSHMAQEQKKRIDQFEEEKKAEFESLQIELSDLRFQIKTKTDKGKALEIQVRESNEEIERIKERVRMDIRKIRTREKELENRLEILKKDSEALIAAREGKIIELKRKLDLLEFNMDLLQDQYSREKEKTEGLKEKLGKVAQVVRVAGGLLEMSKSGASQLSAELEEFSESGDKEKEAS